MDFCDIDQFFSYILNKFIYVGNSKITSLKAVLNNSLKYLSATPGCEMIGIQSAVKMC